MNRYLLLLPALLWSLVEPASAQVYPGGVSGNISLWLKVNTPTAANMTVNPGNAVSSWVNELTTVNPGYAVTQATNTRRPVLLDVPSDTVDFNFNPSLQFHVATQRALAFAGSTPDLLGQSGTAFIVVNTQHPAGSSSSSCFAYMSNSNYRFQIKADFRVQTGNNGTGYTADLNLGGPLSYPERAGRILVSRSTGAGFYARRNAAVMPINNTAALYNPAVGTGLCVGSNSNSGNSEYSNSAIAEIITYATTLSVADINKVESYLAIKYGATLDQTVPANYVASNGTVIWDAAARAGYAYNITGIGRDDLSGLLQKQSRSVNANGMVTVYNDNTGGLFPAMNTINTTTFTSDYGFLLFGDNNGDTVLSHCTQENAGLRIGRIWQVQKTGTIGPVTLAVKNTDIPAATTSLLLSASPLFPGGATQIYPLTDNGTQKYASVNLPDGVYFTFGTDSARLEAVTKGPICEGETLDLVVNGVPAGSSVQWFGPSGYTGVSDRILIPNAKPIHSGTYTAIVSRSGCVLPIITARVTVHPRPEADFDLEVLHGCNEDTVVTYNRSTLFIRYAWNFGDGTVQSTEPDPRHLYDKAGSYKVTLVASSDNHCADTAEQMVEVAPLGGLDLRFDDVRDIRCAGQRTGSFEVAVANGVSPYLYSLNGATPVKYKNFNKLPAGVYTVKVTDQNGCRGMDTVTLNQPERLLLSVDDVQDDYCSKGPASGSALIQLSGGVTPYRILLNEDVYTGPPVVAGLAYGNYTVHVTDAHDCITKDFFDIKEVECCVAAMPTAFSPNGDGRNDMLRPVNSGILLVSFEVYNRWGRQLFSSKEITRGWDGTYEGQPQDIGTYFYAISYVCLETNTMKNEKGDVVIVR